LSEQFENFEHNQRVQVIMEQLAQTKDSLNFRTMPNTIQATIESLNIVKIRNKITEKQVSERRRPVCSGTRVPSKQTTKNVTNPTMTKTGWKHEEKDATSNTMDTTGPSKHGWAILH